MFSSTLAAFVAVVVPQAHSLPASSIEDALTRSKKQRRYLYVLLSQKRDNAYRKLRRDALAALKGMKRKGDFFELDAEADAGKALRRKHGLIDDPLPIVMAISPSGVMTRAYEGVCSPYHLESAMVSPATAAITDALRQHATVVLLFTRPSFSDRKPVIAAVTQFASGVEKVPQIVTIDPGNKAEAELLARCQMPAKMTQTHVMIIRHGYFGRPLPSPKQASQIRRAYVSLAPESCTCGERQ